MKLGIIGNGFADSINLDLPVLKGAWETNLKVRPERDWEKLKGRAVSDDNNKETK